jgi:peptide/nickel transport system ATP-binding protein
MKSHSNPALIRVEGLTKHFPVRLGAYGQQSAVVHAVEDLSLEIREGETLGLVGESGCGKSTVGLSILQLHKPTAGKVHYRDLELTQLEEKEIRPLRHKLQIVFQDPYSTLSPRMTIGVAISEPMKAHGFCQKEELQVRMHQLLQDVGLPVKYCNRYPHEFSGGQRQRICIARALGCNPEFVVCDEPVSALDVSIQAQIINLLRELQQKYGLTYLFIAHDLAVVRYISTRVAVMYLGRLAELAPKDDLFERPLHPYTRALLSAVPVPNPQIERQRKRQILSGDVPSAINPPQGCSFHPRCPMSTELCSQVIPKWRQIQPEHWVACHHAEE